MRRTAQLLTVGIFAMTVSQAAGQELAKEAKAETTRALQWAIDTGKIAGAADYCEMDVDTVEDYISRAQVKIAATATDKVDRVVAKIEFGNVYSVASSQEPMGGCTNFAQLFTQESNKLN